MAVNPGYAGRTFAPSEPYEVSRVKIAEFADAIGETSRLCRDRAAAQAAGYPDVIAPPTFAIVLSLASTVELANDPDRLELKKYCPWCRCHRAHRETR